MCLFVFVCAFGCAHVRGEEEERALYESTSHASVREKAEAEEETSRISVRNITYM